MNCVTKVKVLLKHLGAEIFENNNERGKGGFMFPKIITDKGSRTYIADVFAIYQGKPLVFEVNYKYYGTQRAKVNDDFRTSQLKQFGITVVPFTPAEVDRLDLPLLQREIDYRVFRK